jgi:hypothetical protein
MGHCFLLPFKSSSTLVPLPLEPSLALPPHPFLYVCDCYGKLHFAEAQTQELFWATAEWPYSKWRLWLQCHPLLRIEQFMNQVFRGQNADAEDSPPVFVCTPVHMVVHNLGSQRDAQMKLSHILIHHGIDLGIQDSSGRTVVDIAAEMRRDDVVADLVAYERRERGMTFVSIGSMKTTMARKALRGRTRLRRRRHRRLAATGHHGADPHCKKCGT